MIVVILLMDLPLKGDNVQVDWRIYYEDGSVFDNTQGSWDDAPLDGVQCVAVRHEIYGRQIFSGGDYYSWTPDFDHITSTNDLRIALKPLRWIKYGRHIPSEQYQKVLTQASEDTAFPKTSPRRRASDNPSRDK